MLLSLGVLPSFHSVKKHAPHKWIMPRKPILEFSEHHWNVRSSDPFQGNRQHRRTSFTFRYKCAKIVRRLGASLHDWLLHCHHWSDRFHSNRFCCCRLRSRPTIWPSSREEGQSSQRLSAMQTFFLNFKSWIPKTYSCSLSASEQPALFWTSTS